MFCVCERSRAASTSSRIYMGAGLNWRRAMMREMAIRERWPPDSSVRDCFHTLPVMMLVITQQLDGNGAYPERP
jgi:hypothetical protein